MEEDASMKFFSDQNTSYADILPPREVKFPLLILIFVINLSIWNWRLCLSYAGSC